MRRSLLLDLIVIVTFVIIFAIIGCSTTPSVWNRSNTLRIRQGMTPEQIIAMFGQPDKHSINTYGLLTSRPWQGLLYEYHFWKGGDYCINTFTFALTPDPKLNNWDINCVF